MCMIIALIALAAGLTVRAARQAPRPQPVRIIAPLCFDEPADLHQRHPAAASA